MGQRVIRQQSKRRGRAQVFEPGELPYRMAARIRELRRSLEFRRPCGIGGVSQALNDEFARKLESCKSMLRGEWDAEERYRLIDYNVWRDAYDQERMLQFLEDFKTVPMMCSLSMHDPRTEVQL